MEFYQTNTSVLKHVIEEVRYYAKYRPFEVPMQNIAMFNMQVINDEMMKNGRPYYQVYPDVFEAVSNTTLDLDIDDWKVPFDIFEIRLPKTEKPLIPLQPNSSQGVISIQVFRNFYKSAFICSDNGICMTYKYVKGNLPDELSGFNQLINHTMIKVNACDFSDPSNLYEHHEILATLKYQPEIRILDLVGSTINRVLNKETFYCDDPTLEDMSGCGWMKTLKLALGVSLLATGSQKVLEYDVMSKHLNAYREMRAKGDFKRCREIEDKSKKKGKYGWNIGKPVERHLPLSEDELYGNDGSQGGHHHYCSYRCGHWHKYYVGKNRTKVKLKWLNPTVVRPDLPAKSSA